MVDLQHFLVFVRYEEKFQLSECVVLPERNRFREYDELMMLNSASASDQLSKFVVTKLLDEIHRRT